MISKKFRIVIGYAAVDGSIFKAQPDVEAVSHDADHPAFVDPQLSGIGQSAFTPVELGSTVEESAWGVSCWIAFVSLPGALSEAWP